MLRRHLAALALIALGLQALAPLGVLHACEADAMHAGTPVLDCPMHDEPATSGDASARLECGCGGEPSMFTGPSAIVPAAVSVVPPLVAATPQHGAEVVVLDLSRRPFAPPPRISFPS